MSFREYLNEGTFAIYTVDSNGKAGPKINVKAIDKGNAEFQAKKIVGVKPYRGYTVDRIEEVKAQLKESKFKVTIGHDDGYNGRVEKKVTLSAKDKDDAEKLVIAQGKKYGWQKMKVSKVEELNETDLKESKDIYVDLTQSQEDMVELEHELGDAFFTISWEGFVAVVKPELKTKFLAALKKLKLKHEVL